MVLKAFLAVLGRDLMLAVRHGTDTLASLLFFVLCGSLFPLALSPAPELLHRIGPGIIWVCALLSMLLPLERLFSSDMEDGSLDHLLLLGLSPSMIAFARMTAHWLTTGLPLIIITAPLALMFGALPADLPPLIAGLALGTPLLSLIGGMAAGLVLGARKGGILLPLLVLPLATPILVFGAAAADGAINGQGFRVELDFLGAFLAVALPLCPLAAGGGLRAACS